jgi:hypothetical protein
MSEKLISIILVIAGIFLITISVIADLIGIGGDLNAFGWKQITGVVVGLIIFLVGIRLRSKNR